MTRTPRTPPLATVPDVRGGNQLDANRRMNILREEQLREKRKKNIVVKGLLEDLPDGDEGAVERMLYAMDLGHLKAMTPMAVRVGRSSNDKPRLLIVTFVHERYVQEVLMEKVKLLWTKNNNQYGNFSDVFIDPDMSREKRQDMFAARRANRTFEE